MPDHVGVAEAVEITGLAGDGRGVGRLATGEVVFVAGGLPGDHAELEQAGRRRGVLEARLARLVRPSPDRIPARCPQLRCGGCPLRSLSAPAQGAHKRRRLVDVMRRLGGVDVEALLPPVTTFGDGWGLRHRARLHAAFIDGRWALGYHAAGSHQVVPLSQCPVVWPEVEAIALSLQAQLAGCPRQAALSQVEICYSRRDGRGAARILTNGPVALTRPYVGGMVGGALSACDLVGSDGRYVCGNIELRYDHAGASAFDIKYEPGLFTQACVIGNDELIAAVAQLALVGPSPRVLECYAGVGNFTAHLARQGAQLVAYEHQARAAMLCRRNNQAAGLNVEVVAEDAAAALAEPDAFDVVLLDPPRTGAAALMPSLGRRRQKRVVYVSCDPATLARDTRVLTTMGWQLGGLWGWDMFPQTPHLEAVAFFERGG